MSDKPTCPNCGGPMYVGLTKIECERKCWLPPQEGEYIFNVPEYIDPEATDEIVWPAEWTVAMRKEFTHLYRANSWPGKWRITKIKLTGATSCRIYYAHPDGRYSSLEIGAVWPRDVVTAITHSWRFRRR